MAAGLIHHAHFSNLEWVNETYSICFPNHKQCCAKCSPHYSKPWLLNTIICACRFSTEAFLSIQTHTPLFEPLFELIIKLKNVLYKEPNKPELPLVSLQKSSAWREHIHSQCVWTRARTWKQTLYICCYKHRGLHLTNKACHLCININTSLWK